MSTPSASEPGQPRITPEQARLKTAIAPATAERFRHDLLAAAGQHLPDDAPLAIAVSGGPDSIAMLALAVAAFPGRVVAATFDHRVRVGSAAEARAVGRACKLLGVKHKTLRPALATRVFRHAEARRGRYAALQQWAVSAGAHILLTAHQADDQAETLLMRLNRGCGIAGLSGVRARREVVVSEPVTKQPLVFDTYTLAVIRPLLGWRRQELRTLAEATGLPFVDDPSNTDDRFGRSRVRAFLNEQSFLDPAQLARSADHLGDAEADLRAIARWLWTERRVTPTGVADPDDQIWLNLSALPRELQRRLARDAIADVRLVNGMLPDFDPATNIEPLLDALALGRAATQAGVMVSSHADTWRFRPAPPRRATKSHA